MSDPQRLLEQANDPATQRLLSSALDEPPPPELLARTLQAMGAAGLPAAADTAAKISAPAAGGGILGAVVVGALAGALTVGVIGLVAGARTPPSSAAQAPPPAITAVAPPREAPAEPVRPEAAPPSSARSAASSANAPPSATLAAELELLDEARRALRGGEPAVARALLDRYAREIPRGQLGREATMLRVEAQTAIDAAKTIP